MNDLNVYLKEFQSEHKAVTKGPLSLLIQITRAVRTMSFPINPDTLLTENRGQVAGLGGGNLKKILKEHGITQILASEGGRTSRGNMGLMQRYIAFLNDLHEKGFAVEFSEAEAFWAEQIREYFRNQPFTLAADTSRTIGACLDDLFEQARKRQKQNAGTQYLGAVLQHLVAAKLLSILPQESVVIHGASVADASTDRSGDFVINNTIIHCTTAPAEPLLKKCEANLRSGASPVIITIFERVRTTLDLASDMGLGGRIEVWDIQQFLASNVFEHSHFDNAARNSKLADIIEQYNKIITEYETDPSLRIEFDGK